MDRRIFLHTLAEMGVAGSGIDWRTAPDSQVEQAWDELRQAPFLLNVAATGRLACVVPGETALSEDTSRSAPMPRYRVEQNAYWFFNELGQDASRQLGIVLVESRDATTWHFAQLGSSIDDANTAAKSADMPLRFKKKLSAAEEAWEQQVQSGKVVGMDDPVWMWKTQEQIDAQLEWQWRCESPRV